jgi:PAS domain S-box-containing protein
MIVPGAEINSLQRVLDDFCVITGCPVGIFDKVGNVLMSCSSHELLEIVPGVNPNFFQECAHCLVKISHDIQKGKTWVFKNCEQGFFTTAAPVIVNGRHICNVALAHFILADENTGARGMAYLSRPRAERIVGMIAETLSTYVIRHYNILSDEDAWMLPLMPAKKDVTLAAGLDMKTALEELEESQRALRYSEARYRTLVANIPAIVYRCEIKPPWYMNYISEPILQMTGYNQEDFYLGGKVTYASLVHPEDMSIVTSEIDDSYKEKRLYEMEYRIIDINGSVHWVFERGRFFVDDYGKPLYLDGVIMDITGIKQTKTELLHALNEREYLVKEIHHRVKNNLQAIILLIDKQSEAIPEEYRHFLIVLKNQAYTMALIYDQLNKTRKLSKIEMSSYMEELSLNVASTFPGSERILITVESPDIWMDVNLAMPCAMILNELITNTYKYAFPPDCSGDCHLLIKLALEDDQYILTVRDNGVGINPDQQINIRQNSGTILMKLWAEHQMGGTFKQENNSGTVTTVTFPLRK